eukprot:g7942.t1
MDQPADDVFPDLLRAANTEEVIAAVRSFWDNDYKLWTSPSRLGTATIGSMCEGASGYLEKYNDEIGELQVQIAELERKIYRLDREFHAIQYETIDKEMKHAIQDTFGKPFTTSGFLTKLHPIFKLCQELEQKEEEQKRKQLKDLVSSLLKEYDTKDRERFTALLLAQKGGATHPCRRCGEQIASPAKRLKVEACSHKDNPSLNSTLDNDLYSQEKLEASRREPLLVMRPQRLCVICRCAWAAGELHTSPDGVRLWRPGTALGTLGNTVFAVARDGCGDNLGAFTTTEVNPGNVGGGIFFDGSVSPHPKLALEPPTTAHATHFLSWEAVCIDGFGLLDLYKWHQNRVLKRLALHDGTWERFRAQAGQSIVFELPPALRYQGSAQLVNSGDQQPLLVLKKPAYVWPGLRRPYLTCGTGQNPVFRAGSELRWSYIIQEDKQIAAAPTRALGDREGKGHERRLRSAVLPNRAGKKDKTN